MTYSGVWAIDKKRIEEFFILEPDVEAEEEGFRYKSCLITLTLVEDNSSFILKIPRTRVEISGSDEDTEAIHRRFFLRFFSAGG